MVNEQDRRAIPWTLPIEDGQDLVEVLRSVAPEGAGWVSAVGRLETVRLLVAAEREDRIINLRGRVTLVGLSGPVRGPYLVSLARVTDVGLEMSGGVLEAARTLGVTAAFWLANHPTGVSASPEPPLAAAPGGWIAQAHARAEATALEAQPAAAEPEPGEPEVGDLVDHFAFGLCDVLMADGESLRIRDCAGRQRVREIRLDKLEILPPNVHDGKRLFKLVRRG